MKLTPNEIILLIVAIVGAIPGIIAAWNARKSNQKRAADYALVVAQAAAELSAAYEPQIAELKKEVKELRAEVREWREKYDKLYDWAMQLVLQLIAVQVYPVKPPDGVSLPDYNKKRKM